MDVRARLSVNLLEERWVPASPPTTPTTGGPGGLTAAQQAQLAAAAQQAGVTLPADDTAETMAAGTTMAATTTLAAPTFLPDRGTKSSVTLVTSTGTAGSTVSVYDPAFTGGVWAARADVTGDGTPDAISAPGVGMAPTVKVIDGADGRVVRTFDAYESGFTGGVIVAAVDLNGDGRADLITGTDTGGGPRVRIFDGLTGASLVDFFAIDDPAFRGGVRVAAGDVNGDGVPDLVAAAGFGGGPRVAVWDGKALLRGVQQRVTGDFFAFEPALRNGVYPAVGAYNGDKFADILLGAGPGGGPRVKAVSGALLAAGDPAAADKPLFDFFAGLADDRGGVRVGAVPGAGTGTTAVNDVLTVGGSGGIGTLFSGSTQKGSRSVDRELILGGGLLADASGQRLFTGTATGTGTGGTTTGGATGLGSNLGVGSALQQLLDQLAGQTIDG